MSVAGVALKGKIVTEGKYSTGLEQRSNDQREHMILTAL